MKSNEKQWQAMQSNWNLWISMKSSGSNGQQCKTMNENQRTSMKSNGKQWKHRWKSMKTNEQQCKSNYVEK